MDGSRSRKPTHIEPLLRQLRDTMWHEQSSLGLWYSMAFVLKANGCVFPRFDYESAADVQRNVLPTWSRRGPTSIRAPRPAKWVPAWLAAS